VYDVINDLPELSLRRSTVTVTALHGPGISIVYRGNRLGDLYSVHMLRLSNHVASESYASGPGMTQSLSHYH
jgi:hypothetical protein